MLGTLRLWFVRLRLGILVVAADERRNVVIVIIANWRLGLGRRCGFGRSLCRFGLIHLSLLGRR
jgi:hypothetical protein